jgi:hypothetical protein
MYEWPRRHRITVVDTVELGRLSIAALPGAEVDLTPLGT